MCSPAKLNGSSVFALQIKDDTVVHISCHAVTPKAAAEKISATKNPGMPGFQGVFRTLRLTVAAFKPGHKIC